MNVRKNAHISILFSWKCVSITWIVPNLEQRFQHRSWISKSKYYLNIQKEQINKDNLIAGEDKKMHEKQKMNQKLINNFTWTRI